LIRVPKTSDELIDVVNKHKSDLINVYTSEVDPIFENVSKIKTSKSNFYVL